MIYKSGSSAIRELIDYYKTGKYGEEEYPEKVYCLHCGATIRRGNQCYIIKENFYCMDCSEIAEKRILEICRDGFLYDL